MQKLLKSPFFNVSILTISWALQIFIAKLAFIAGAKLFTFSIQTLIVTSVFLLLYILPKIKDFKKLSLSVFLWLCVIGALGSGIGGTFSNAGVGLTTAINAGFLFQVDIALTVIFAWMILKEKLDKTKILMLFMILVGSFFLTTNGRLTIPHVGDLLILAACVCYALSTVLARKFLKNTSVDPDFASFLRSFVSTPVLLAVILMSSIFPEAIRKSFEVNLLDFKQFFYVILNSLALFALLIFLNRSLKLASASYTAMMSSAMPFLVAILGVIFLKESLTLIQFFGALLIISASFVTFIVRVDKH
jgi:drug/metabolite transporter (DMT)-like permease